MNRTHLIILTVGFGGCFALMILMGRLLKMQPTKADDGPIAKSLAAALADQLVKPARLVVEVPRRADKSAAGKPPISVTVRVVPKATVDTLALVEDIGSFLWPLDFPEGELRRITIRVVDAETNAVETLRLIKPGGRRSKRLSRGRPRAKPSARSAPASRPSTPPVAPGAPRAKPPAGNR